MRSIRLPELSAGGLHRSASVLLAEHDLMATTRPSSTSMYTGFGIPGRRASDNRQRVVICSFPMLEVGSGFGTIVRRPLAHDSMSDPSEETENGDSESTGDDD